MKSLNYQMTGRTKINLKTDWRCTYILQTCSRVWEWYDGSIESIQDSYMRNWTFWNPNRVACGVISSEANKLGCARLRSVAQRTRLHLAGLLCGVQNSIHAIYTWFELEPTHIPLFLLLPSSSAMASSHTSPSLVVSISYSPLASDHSALLANTVIPL